MGRIAGVPNKLTTEVKDKLQTVIDDVVSQLDISEMTTDQKIKMLQIGLHYLLPKLQSVSDETGKEDTPLFREVQILNTVDEKESKANDVFYERLNPYKLGKNFTYSFYIYKIVFLFTLN